MREPLGLPRGTVRAVLTGILLIAAVASCFLPTPGGAQETLLALAGIAVRDYFGHRSTQNEQDGPQLPAPSANEEA